MAVDEYGRKVTSMHDWGDKGLPTPFGRIPVKHIPGVKQLATATGEGVGYVSDAAKDVAGTIAKGALIGAAGLTLAAAKGVGKAGWATAKGAGKFAMWGAPKVGNAAFSVAEGIGNVGIAAVRGMSGMYDPYKRRPTIQKIASRLGEGAMNFADGMVRYTPKHMEYNRYRNKMEHVSGKMHMTKGGALLIGLGGLAASAISAYKDEKAQRMGSIVSKPVTATPDYAPRQYETAPSHSYLDNAGATGDLVFALNALRH